MSNQFPFVGHYVGCSFFLFYPVNVRTQLKFLEIKFIISFSDKPVDSICDSS